MNRVFVDTVGFLALWDERDQWHGAALAAFEGVRLRRLELVSSTMVFLELGNAAARKPYRETVMTFRDIMERDGTLLEATTSEVIAGWANYGSREGAGAGIVDQISFLMMRRLGIQEALTNDAHFRAAGFSCLM